MLNRRIIDHSLKMAVGKKPKHAAILIFNYLLIIYIYIFKTKRTKEHRTTEEEMEGPTAS